MSLCSLNSATPQHRYQEENTIIKANEEGLRNLDAILSLQFCLCCVLRCHWSTHTKVDFGGTCSAALGALNALGRLVCAGISLLSNLAQAYLIISQSLFPDDNWRRLESVIPISRNSHIGCVSRMFGLNWQLFLRSFELKLSLCNNSSWNYLVSDIQKSESQSFQVNCLILHNHMLWP